MELVVSTSVTGSYTVSTGDFDMASDYRVVFEPFEEGSDIGEYSIREVYYDVDGEISWWSDVAVQLFQDDFWDLAADFDAMAEAFEQPVLILINDELIEDPEEYDEDSESEDEDEDEE